MARASHLLKDIQIKNAKAKEKLYKLTDGDGLYVAVLPTGSKSFRRDYVKPDTGKRQTYIYGMYPAVRLETARQKNREFSALLAEGIDPKEHKNKEKAQADVLTVGDLLQEWLERSIHIAGNRESTAAHKRTLVERHLMQTIGPRPLVEVRARELMDFDVLKRLEHEGKLETVRRLAKILEAVFKYAYQKELIEKNPALYLAEHFKRPAVTHRAAILEPKRFGELLRAIDNYETSESSLYYALRLLPLTFTRISELCEARWEEIDFEKNVWSIPANRMKMDRPFRVPLARQVSEIFRELLACSDGSEYVCSSRRSKLGHIRIETVGAAIKRMGFAGDEVTPHGFRSTANTFLHQYLHYPTDVIEAALAHGKKVALGMTYDRSDYFEDRIPMMQAWADYCDELREGGKS